MTGYEVGLNQLLDTREKLINTIKKQLSPIEKEFLISVKEGSPKYNLMPFQDLDKLPALNWKLRNREIMDDKKHKNMLEKLKIALNI